MKSYVYETTNNINGMKYIGAKNGSHLKPYYLGSSPKLKRDIKKYGRENFNIRIIKSFEREGEAFDYERNLIEDLEANKDPNYYNCKPGGAGYSLTGRVIVSKEDKIKIIEPKELDDYLSEGWIKGYPESFKSKFISSCGTGTVWMNDGESSARIKKEDVNYFLSIGFNFGLLTHKNAGRIRITNDFNDNKLINEEDLPYWESKGYYRGYHKKTDGYVRIHREGINKLVPPEKLEEYLRDGWQKGYVYRRKKS